VVSAISAAWPTITANVNLQGTDYIYPKFPSTHLYETVISLNVPIFSGFLYMNQIRQTKENVKTAKESFRIAENNALLDVVTSYYNFKTAKESLEYSEEFLKYAQEAYALASEGYREGTASILDLLTSWSTLSDAKAQKIQARTQLAFSLFNIAFATGSLDLSLVREQLHTASIEKLQTRENAP
jgi:outer membrane protein TolC